MHQYHTILCPTIKGWAETCTCAERLTFDQLNEKQQEQVKRLQSIVDPAKFLYSLGDGRIISRVAIAEGNETDEQQK